MKPIKTKTLSVADTERLTALTVDVADHARIAGLSLAASLEETVAEEAALEAARYAYLHGPDSENAKAAANRMKAIAEATATRAKALKSEAEKAQTQLDAVLDADGDDENDVKQAFVLSVALANPKGAPVAGATLILTHGKKQIGSEISSDKGRARFLVPVKGTGREGDAVATGKLQRARETAELTLVAVSDKGDEIARDTRSVALSPGGTDEWQLTAKGR